MNKQKSAFPSDVDIKKPKIRKLATQSYRQTQSLSQPINCTPIIVPTIVNNYEELTQYWESAKKNELALSQNQTQGNLQAELTERKNELEKFNTEIQKLRINIDEEKTQRTKKLEFIEETSKKRDAIVEAQNLATKLHASIKKHIDAIINTQDHFTESLEHLSQLYNNVAMKQEDIIENLNEQIVDRVSKQRKELKEQLYSKSNELLALNESNQFGEVEKERTRLLNEIDTQIEEYEAINDEHKQEHRVEIAQMLESIKEDKLNLEIVREAKFKLEPEYSQSSEEFEVLITKYKSLEVTDLGYQSENNSLTSILLELQEQEVALNNQLDELKDIHHALLSNRELEAGEYRKKLRDVTSLNTEASDKLSEAVLKNEELSTIVSKTVENTEELENVMKITNDEMIEIGKILKNVWDNNEELKKIIQTQNKESIEIENEIGENKAGFETHKAKRDKMAHMETKVSAEVLMTEQQLSNESEECSALLEEIDEEKTDSAEKSKEFREKMKEIDETIVRERKADEDLQQVIGRKQSDNKKKIQDAILLTKECQSMGHERVIRELNAEINIVSRKLSSVKLKNKLAHGKKQSAKDREKEKYETHVKRIQSNNEDLKKKLSKMRGETEGLLKELKEAQASTEAKNADQEKFCQSSIPKPILKSAGNKSPLKVQKVKFNLPTSLDYNSINISQEFEELERYHSEISTSEANTTNKGQIQIPIIPDEPDTTSAVVEKIKAPQPRKFFSRSRSESKKSYRFGKK